MADQTPDTERIQPAGFSLEYICQRETGQDSVPAAGVDDIDIRFRPYAPSCWDGPERVDLPEFDVFPDTHGAQAESDVPEMDTEVGIVPIHALRTSS